MSQRKGNKWSRVTQKDIDLAHVLKEAGLSVTKAQKAMGRGYKTVEFMYQAKDLSEYHQLRKEYQEKREAKARKPQKPQQDKLVEAPSIRDFLDTNDTTDISPRQFQKALLSQQNTIIALLKAIEFKLDVRS